MLRVKIAVGGVEMGFLRGFRGESVRIFVERAAIMRRFEHALRLDERPIGEIRINVKSRDDIPALLLGLQHLYVSCREEWEGLLSCHVTADQDPENGRPGMTALAGSGDGGAQAGFGLRLRPSGGVGEPSPGLVRKMLQHGFLDDWTYSVRTLQDNVSLG